LSRLKVTLVLLLILFIPTLIPSLVRADSGTGWTKYSGNPVLGPTPGAWDSGSTTAPVVLYDGSVYRMWYDGSHVTATGIGFANSTDGIHWTKYPQPVLQPGPAGSWDSSQVKLGSVIWNGTIFLMAYFGENATTFVNGAIGIAGSKDGITWVKYSGNPVLTPGGVDSAIGRPFGFRWQTTYNIWYGGKAANEPASSPVISIFYAISTNGMTWTKYPVNPVLSPTPGAWDSQSVSSPTVVRANLTFGLWYTGLKQNSTSPQIGYATSMDGATWNKTSGPVLTPGPSNWDAAGVEQPDVLPGPNGYLMYYDGFGFNQTSPPSIGLAFAPQSFRVPELQVPQIGLLVAILACGTVYLVRRRRA